MSFVIGPTRAIYSALCRVYFCLNIERKFKLNSAISRMTWFHGVFAVPAVLRFNSIQLKMIHAETRI